MTQIKNDERVFKKIAPEPKRARNKAGQLQADDPSTPDVNEAWEGGKAPTKKSTPKKKAASRGKKSVSKS
jgi:hypothetical protein